MKAMATLVGLVFAVVAGGLATLQVLDLQTPLESVGNKIGTFAANLAPIWVVFVAFIAAAMIIGGVMLLVRRF